MSKLHISHVEKRLRDTTLPHVDLSDISNHGSEQRGRSALTRALAAFVVMKNSDLSAEEAAETVTDGPRDNGIDAIAVLPNEPRMIVVQTKWSEEGRGSASLEDMIKFREGINDLIDLNWSNFSAKITDRSQEIEALLMEPTVEIQAIFAHMGASELADDVRSRLDTFIAEINDPTDFASFTYLNQAQLHRLLIDEQKAPDIDLSLELSDWGKIEGPQPAIYGHVGGDVVGSWLTTHGHPLLSKNVRVVLPDSEVNSSVLTTIRQNPEDFWYFNNGVTVLCDRIEKSPIGGSDRRQGQFTFKGVSVVNGAQTVGSLAKAAAQGEQDQLSSTRVMVRFISLEGAAEGFGKKVTRATNTQNRIGGRDFVGLDPQQSRLSEEFSVADLQYVYRSGETDPPADQGCTVVEAAVALACCSENSSLATQAKREVSRLWDDISKPPYKQLFNASVTYLRVWRAVQIARVVDAKLRELARTLEARERGYSIHGNRTVLHLVFRQIDISKVDDPSEPWEEKTRLAESLVEPTLRHLINVGEREYGGYLASLFKNTAKTTYMCRRVLAALH
jgi:hypothetical protein